MKRIALFLFFLLMISGCELGTDAVDDTEYWWLNDPRFDSVRDRIDVKASLPLEEYGMVFLKPESYAGEEARQRMLNRYGKLGYHLMVWHSEEFQKQLNERIRNGESLNFDGENVGVGNTVQSNLTESEGESAADGIPMPDEGDDPGSHQVITQDPCDCPYNEAEPPQCG